MVLVNTKRTKNHQTIKPLYSDNGGFLGNKGVLDGRNAGYEDYGGFRLYEMKKPPLSRRFRVGVTTAG